MDSYHNFNPNAPPPPPNPPPEFNHQNLQQQQRPPLPPPQWYPNQSHYQPTLQPPPLPMPPPPPPPPGIQNQYPTHPQQWNPHPTENHAPYPPPPVPYPNQQYHQYPPQMHHHPPYHVNQEWGYSNWTHHPGYENPGQGHTNDWATKAKAWAAAKNAMDSQQQQSLLPHNHSVRTELQTQFHDQVANVADPQHLEMKPALHPVAFPQNPYGVDNYQQVPFMDGQSSNMSGAYQYGQGTFNSASMTPRPDNQVNKDGSLADDSGSTVHQKEVPSSYPSSAGKEVIANQSQMQFSSYPGPGNAIQGGHQLQGMPPAADQQELLGRPFSYHNHNGDLSDKPLDFAHRGNVSAVYPHHGQSGQHNGVESSTTMPITHSWASHLAPGSIYPSAANSGSQFDPSMSTPSPVPGQVAPLFGTTAASIFPHSLPSVSGPMGPGGLTSLDPYGASYAERPKKAAVPNWLKEEIIKNKAVMATSAHEYRREETQFEDETGHQSFAQDDQAESKSIDSLRAADEEDNDEDYVEAARNAAINKEIKRVLTEVLLKVTDNLFDEIATRVLSEEEATTEAAINQFPAKVLVPDKPNGNGAEDNTGSPSSELPEGLLGLVSYGTDSDDEIDEISTQEQMNHKKHGSVRNGHSPGENNHNGTKYVEKLDAASSVDAENADSFGRRVVEELGIGPNDDDTKRKNDTSSLDMKNNVQDKEQSNEDRTNKSFSPESRNASDTKAAEYKMSSQSSVTNVAIDRVKENQSGGKHEKHPSKGELDNNNGPKDRKKEGFGTDERQKDPISRKRPSHYDEKYKTEIETGKRNSGRENNKTDQLEDDRSRHKHSSNSSRHKKRHSPALSNRLKKNRTDSSVSGGSSTNDESLDDSERDSRSKRRHRSPSSVRSRKRQVSRSPENSQRRQSSYYSVEASRKKRSRSPRRHR